jgi:hypothetical protein
MWPWLNGGQWLVGDHGHGGREVAAGSVETGALARSGSALGRALAIWLWLTKTRRSALFKWAISFSMVKKIIFQIFQTTSSLQNMKVVLPTLKKIPNVTKR